jgi:hypothetical protein
VALSQPRYIEDVLRRFGMFECKPAVTPMDEAFFTGFDAEEDKAVVDVELYLQIIGSLMYLALRTRSRYWPVSVSHRLHTATEVPNVF